MAFFPSFTLSLVLFLPLDYRVSARERERHLIESITISVLRDAWCSYNNTSCICRLRGCIIDTIAMMAMLMMSHSPSFLMLRAFAFFCLTFSLFVVYLVCLNVWLSSYVSLVLASQSLFVCPLSLSLSLPSDHLSIQRWFPLVPSKTLREKERWKWMRLCFQAASVLALNSRVFVVLS